VIVLVVAAIEFQKVSGNSDLKDRLPVIIMMLLNKSYLIAFAFIMVLPNTLFAAIEDYKYTIVLQSTSNEFKLNDVRLPVKYRGSKYKLYLSKTTLKNKRTSFRLKLGFFKNKKTAYVAINRLKKKFSRLWLSEVNESDKAVLKKWYTKLEKSQIKKSKKKILKSIKNPEMIMAKAKKAMTNKKYRTAISLYTKVINSSATKYHKQAQEFLGVAREKNGQLIHARAEYRIFLKKYPDGEDAIRVNQRLLALNTILLRPKKKLRKTKSKLSDWQHFGSVSQFYRSDTTTSVDVLNSNETETSAATLSSVFNYISRKRTESLHIKSQLTASHLYYIDNPVKKERGRINIAFVDFAAANKDKSIRIGRQSQNRAGAPGRMDGAWVEYRMTPGLKVNLVGGYPVNTTLSNTLQKNKPFYGISFDFTSEDKALDYSFYTIEQKVDSIIDRSALGTEFRYRKGMQNHFLLLDYDNYFNELNTFYFIGNWRFSNSATVVATLNYRNSPILTTSNALQGQGTQTIESLLTTLSEEQVKQIALDRTARYSSASISSYFKLSKNWVFSGDMTVAKLDSTPTTPANPPIVEILGQESTGNEYFYNLQFLSNDLFSSNEIIKYQISYADTKTYNKTRYIVSSSFKYNNKWRYRPKLSYEDRISSSGVKTQRIIPAIRVDYKPTRHFKWEFDASYGSSNEISTSTNPIEVRQDDLSLSIGFIWDF